MTNRKQPVCSQQKTVPEQSIKHSSVFNLHHEQVSQRLFQAFIFTTAFA